MFRYSKLRLILRVCSLASLLLVGVVAQASGSCITVAPSSLNLKFGSFAVGSSSLIQDIVLTNKCGSNITYSSISISNSAFLLVFGWAPVTKQNNTTNTFGVRFAPPSAGTFNGTFTINISGQNPVVVNMSGTGFVTQAAASLTTSSLTFGNQPVGTSSPSQPLTITNTGTAAFTVDSVYADPPFTITGFSGKATLISPGASLPLQVTFSPWQAVAYNGTLVMTSDQLPPKGVTLTGTGTAATALAISNYPVLDSATQGFAYYAQLNGTAGTAPYTYQLASGSNLPSGLTLSAQGLISGTLASSVAVGNYSFTVNITDSASNTASALLTVPVGAPNKANCANYVWNVAGTNTPLTPLNDLGTGTYLGAIGGLYENGSNTMPASHDTDGVNYANAIQPLDGNGNPDPNGKYAMLSIGMSTAYATFLEFVQDAAAEPTINPHLVFVPGAMPGASAQLWASKTFSGWTMINQFLLPQAGVTANQVVAAWVVDTDPGITGTFPSDMTKLQSEFETIAQLLHTNFPNLTIAFFGSRFYGGYSNGLPTPTSPEPYAYETAFAVRGMIEDQLNGVAAMNYNPANGPVKAPWVAWADYDWANGLIGRSDGLTWSCQDFAGDGTHNSNPPGREKDTNLMLNFFRTDDATVPWFLAP
jgi:hypothetical protein